MMEKDKPRCGSHHKRMYSAVHHGWEKWGLLSGVHCWTGAPDQLLVRWDGSFITDVHSHGVFREYTTPNTFLLIIMDDVGHTQEGPRCTFISIDFKYEKGYIVS
jgi:hypothetical protein